MEDLTGRIKLIKDLETFSSGTVKQQIVITTDSQFPQDLPIDFFKDKVDYLQSFAVGDEVIVGANLRGSEFNDKHYVSLVGWRILKKPLQ